MYQKTLSSQTLKRQVKLQSSSLHFRIYQSCKRAHPHKQDGNQDLQSSGNTVLRFLRLLLAISSAAWQNLAAAAMNWHSSGITIEPHLMHEGQFGEGCFQARRHAPHKTYLHILIILRVSLYCFYFVSPLKQVSGRVTCTFPIYTFSLQNAESMLHTPETWVDLGTFTLYQADLCKAKTGLRLFPTNCCY